MNLERCFLLLQKEGSMENVPSIKTKEVSPKYYAQQCPVCNGFGTLRHGTKICQACYGKGYILVPTGQTEGQNYGRKNS